MGGTSAAAAEGAEALFLNPAALSRMDPESPAEAALGYDALLETAYAGSAAWAMPLGRSGALGAGLLYASQGAQTSYDALGNASGSFTPSDLALDVSYAHRLGPVALGGGLKALRSSLAEKRAVGAAADFGILARRVAYLGEAPLDLGASVTNLGPAYKLGGTADPLPLRARLGALWRVAPTFDAALDAVFPVDQDPYVCAGAEMRFPASMAGSTKPWTAALRFGYDQSRTRGVEGLSGLTAGGGLDFSRLRVDYAWLPYGDLGMTNRVTLAVRF